jgi:ribosomal protein S18 acetylase RimI-like enzyme
MPISFRQLKPGDETDYRRIRLACLQNFPDRFGSTFAEEAASPRLKFEEYIAKGSTDHLMFGAFAADELVGIAGFSRQPRAKTRHRGEIVQMYVDPGFRGRRLGENILAAVIDAAFALDGVESIELSVVADNAAASRLYQKLGFEIYGRRKNYFKSGDRYWDQLFMELDKGRLTPRGATED